MHSAYRCALLICTIIGNAGAAEVTPGPPSSTQQEASIWVARLIDRYHYKPVNQPDVAGARPYARFVEALDPERLVFTEGDLEAMAEQGARLDKLTEAKQMEIPSTIFAAYLTRLTALRAYADEVLRQPLRFDGNERIQRIRSKAGWEPDEKALRDLWRRRVMDDYLNLRLAGKPEAQIIPALQLRYDQHVARARAMDGDEVGGLFLNAYVQSFDPNGAYVQPPKTRATRLPDNTVGVGMALRRTDDLVTVLEITPGGPAEQSRDIKLGARIMGVAQGAGPMVDVTGWRLADVVGLLRGPAGSSVALDTLPPEAARGSRARRIVLKRARLRSDDLRARGRIELIQQGETVHRVAVVTVPTFYQDYAGRKAGATDYMSVTRDVAAALEQLKAQKPDAVLLDMRANSGGSLIEAVQMTGLFLPGAAVVQQVAYDGKVTFEMAPAGQPAWDGPLAILIDRGSAAATEIMAAAIQGHGRGLIIGDTSYGRSSIQWMFKVDRFLGQAPKPYGELKLTIAVWCRPTGEPIEPVGVTPDIIAPGRIDLSGKANVDLYGPAPCKTQSMPKRTDMANLLPALTSLQAARMQANQGYQAHIRWRAQDEARMASEEVSLNEAERRRAPQPRSDGDMAQFQLAEALRVVSDAVGLMRRLPAPTTGNW